MNYINHNEVTSLNLLMNFFYNYFFIYIKIFKNLSAKYYQVNKERQKKARERYQNLSKEEKEKKATIWLLNVTKIS